MRDKKSYPQHPVALPDDVAMKIASVAHEYGYRVSVLELCWLTADGVGYPPVASVRYSAEDRSDE